MLNHIFLQCFWITYFFDNPNFLSSEVEVHKNDRIKILIGLGFRVVAFFWSKTLLGKWL